MEIYKTAKQMQERSLYWESQGWRIGFVPTMGYLHEGHTALMRECRKRCDILVVSIFVNPIQFDNASDLANYPRNEESDMSVCRKAGVNAVYFPTPDAMYPPGYRTYVDVHEMTSILCGASRAGHFRGVTTVCTKLFNTVRPAVAVFGEKDFQQLAVIRRMVEDLNLPIEIVGHPTVREKDGLAMSSRNARLGAQDRINALSIYHALKNAAVSVAAGEFDAGKLISDARQTIEAAGSAGIDYIEIRNPDSLLELERVEGPAQMFIAAHFGPVRLIDNMKISA